MSRSFFSFFKNRFSAFDRNIADDMVDSFIFYLIIDFLTISIDSESISPKIVIFVGCYFLG